MRRIVVLGSLFVAGALSITIAAQQKPRPPLPELTRVKENFYVIQSANPADQFTGGNTGVFIMEKGVAIVDTKLADYGPDILARIKAVTPKPVTTIINTHTHGDHNGSNPGFPATVEIITHENTRTNMEKMPAFKTAPNGLPKRTFKDRLTLFSGKDQIDLYHFGAGHTNGDTFIYFPALRTLQAGDMFPWKYAPFIDPGNGGSGVAWPETLSKLLAAVKDVDTVIPGHIPPTTRADLEEYQRYTADLVAAVRTAKKAGQTAEAAAKSIDLTTKYKGYTSERLAAAVQVIYAEIP
jgi:glyoxylase-like metal-dependent hydrolase (beta-lactamase superfamily II)